MKDILKAIIGGLIGLLGGNENPGTKRVAIVALIVIILAILLFHFAGCMTTTDLDGKVYSVRVDILTPIMPTTGPAAAGYPQGLRTNGRPPARPTTQPRS